MNYRSYLNMIMNGDKEFVSRELTVALISILVLTAIVVFLLAFLFHRRNESDALAKEIQDACETANPDRFKDE